MMRGFSIYVHIPFCHHKCPYCDFNTYAVSHIPEGAYTSSLLSELDARSMLPDWRGRTVRSIYFGGGTPSLFSPKSIRKILSTIASIFPVDPSAEISLEANPGTTSLDTLVALREGGVNRISFGVQSFTIETLKALGRIHTPDQADAAIAAAQDAGFSNINVDLMYGAPGQRISDLQFDIHHALSHKVPHISAYGLTIEEGTPFYQSFKRGTLKLPNEDISTQMMALVNESLEERGIHRYEISNFSVPGREAQHNLAYWDGSDYLGLGAGAHSFLRESGAKGWGRRWSNFALPKRYMEVAVAEGVAESWVDELSHSGAIFEFFFLGLRRIQGVSSSEFESRFGRSIQSIYPELIQILAGEGLIESSSERLALTERGLMLADSVIENFASAMPDSLVELTGARKSPSPPPSFTTGPQ